MSLHCLDQNSLVINYYDVIGFLVLKKIDVCLYKKDKRCVHKIPIASFLLEFEDQGFLVVT